MKVLFVCTGNTCRSPLAEALARREAISRGWLDVDVESAGTHAMHGSPASDGALLVGIERGLDLSGHMARQLTPALIESADLILAMSPGHVAAVAAAGGASRTWLLSAFASDQATGPAVSDPFGGDLDTYRETADELGALTRAAFDRLERQRAEARSA